MAEEATARGRLLRPTSLLLVFGIPASGKTLLTRRISRLGGQQETDWSWVAVHFDDFYPPDFRSRPGYVSEEHFDLKEARRDIQRGLEILLSRNLHKEAQQEDVAALPHETKQQAMASKLVQYINSQRPLFDDAGRLRVEEESSTQHPIVIILDDNMPLRSMRYEYYKMARKYQMGFAEVCVQCSVGTALSRNSTRPTPIPDATITAMEQCLETPNPLQHHWEKRSHTLNNDAGGELMEEASTIILSLVRESLADPVLPAQEIDMELQEACRVANLKSRVHQADNVLRKCVSRTLQASGREKDTKAEIAKRANLARRDILSEVQSGIITSGNTRWSVRELEYEQLQSIVEENFDTHLRKHN